MAAFDCLPLPYEKFDRLIYRGAHIILSLLLFFSSTGVVINKHYCQKVLKNSALFAKAKTCNHGPKSVECPVHGTMEIPSSDDDGCCDDQVDYLQGEEERIAPSQQDVDHMLTVFFKSPGIPEITTSIYLLASYDHYQNYKPPLIFCDLPVRLQTFLC